jgi:ribosome-associated protein
MASAAQHGRRASAPDKPARGHPEELLQRVLTSLDDDKALDVVTIGLQGRSTLADAMVIASGRSHRHVGAMADNLTRRLKDAGYGNVRVEGLPHCDWVLIDAADVVVHLFRPEVRDFYNLEKIWSAEVPGEHRVM